MLIVTREKNQVFRLGPMSEKAIPTRARTRTPDESALKGL